MVLVEETNGSSPLERLSYKRVLILRLRLRK